MPSFSLHTLRMKFQKLVDIVKDAQEYPDRQYVHSYCTVGKSRLIPLAIWSTIKYYAHFQDYVDY